MASNRGKGRDGSGVGVLLHVLEILLGDRLLVLWQVFDPVVDFLFSLFWLFHVLKSALSFV